MNGHIQEQLWVRGEAGGTVPLVRGPSASPSLPFWWAQTGARANLILMLILCLFYYNFFLLASRVRVWGLDMATGEVCV